ncbi:MAG: ABC transporter permease [Caldilineaceae bacterium]
MHVLNYFLQRLLTSLIVIVGVLALTFFAARVVPSDPARLYAGPRARPEQLAKIRAHLGLDRPLIEQFVVYLVDASHGDWGDSFKTKRSVRQDLAIFLPATLELVITGFALAIIVGIPIGIMAGANPGGVGDRCSGLASILGASAPVFAVALLFQSLFFNRLHWLPLNGRQDVGVSLAHPLPHITGFLLIDAAADWYVWRDAALHLMMPALVVAVYPLCIVLRMTRNCVVEAMREPHITVALAKGLSHRQVVVRHALPNAILPVMTIAGITFAYAVTGTVLVELIFRWPGVGFYVADAIASRDFPVIVAVTWISTVIFVTVTFVLDMLRLWFDPRTRTSR